MKPTQISRPQFPPGYVDHPISEVSWEYVAAQLTEAKNYWLCSVRPDGRPHCVPRWAVYLDGKIYYDGSPETRHARNIVENPHVSLHLESGSRAIILEGTSQPAGKPSAELAGRLSAAYKAKYAADGYAPEPDQWDQEWIYMFSRHVNAWPGRFSPKTRPNLYSRMKIKPDRFLQIAGRPILCSAPSTLTDGPSVKPVRFGTYEREFK